jgi:hypothetical protein
MKPSSAQRGWAMGIVGGFVVFVGGILSLVFLSMSKDVDLVTDQYYDRELRYQDRIQALDRASRPDAAITVEERQDTLLLLFPPTVGARKIAGSVVLYRPADPGLDKTIPMRPDKSGRQVIATAGLAPGLWRVKLEWKVDGVEYYTERVVVVQ